MVMDVTGNVNSHKLPLEAIVATFKSTKQNGPQEYFIGDKEIPEEQE